MECIGWARDQLNPMRLGGLVGQFAMTMDGWQLEQCSPLNQRDGRIRSCRKGKEWEHTATEMNQYKACQLNHCWIVSR